MFIRFLENIGDKVIIFFSELYEYLLFFFTCTLRMFSLNSYTQSSRYFLLEQIYLSCIKKLVKFIIFALIFGSILIAAIISMAINFSFTEQLGDLLISSIINELAPLFSAIFFVLTYSLSLNEKIQNINRENKDLITEVYIPKIINACFMLPLMSLLFVNIIFVSGFVVSFFYFKFDLLTYKEMILNSIALENILILFIKSFIFGFIAISVPLYFGHKKKNRAYELTHSIIKILTIILSVLVSFELISIIVLY